MSHSSLIREGLLYELKRRPEGKNPFDRFGGRNFYIVISCFSNVANTAQTAKAPRHLRKRFVRLKKFSRAWIDKCDADRHVRKNFFVEDNFAFNAPRRFGLAPIKSAPEPGKNDGQSHQPYREDSH